MMWVFFCVLVLCSSALVAFRMWLLSRPADDTVARLNSRMDALDDALKETGNRLGAIALSRRG